MFKVEFYAYYTVWSGASTSLNQKSSYVINLVDTMLQVRPYLKKDENAALFPAQVRPTVYTVIRYENGAFRKRCFNRRNLKKSALMWTENILKTELFEMIMWFPCPSSNTNPKWPVNVPLPTPASCGGKTFDAFSEWKRHFQIAVAHSPQAKNIWKNVDWKNNQVMI